MAKKVLYYLGAGASANAIPVVNEFSEKLIAFGEELRNDNLYPSFRDEIEELYTDIIEIANESNNYETIDTYAKHLWLIGENLKYNRLKFIISFFLSVLQIQKGSFDNRYKTWLIGILQSKKFPDNIKILSWNYDFQLEIAIQKYAKAFGQGPRDFLPHYPAVGTGIVNPNASFMHLNGCAGYFEEGQFVNHLLNTNENVSEFINIRYLLKKESYSKIKFAWEVEEIPAFQQTLKNLVLGTEIIVMIGYSIPNFNHEIDKKIFDIINSSDRLQTIYYQNIEPKESLRHNFNIDNSVNIIPITDPDKFYIPLEM